MKSTSGASVVARRYGKALLEVALDQKVDPHLVAGGVDAIAELTGSHTDLVRLFASPAVPAPKKLAVLDELLSGKRLDPLVSNLLRVLARNDRLPLLSEVALAYRKALDDHERIASAEVTTPAPLTDAQQKALAARLGALTGKTVRLAFETEPDLLGGVVIRIGNYVYDASLPTQLEKLKERILQAR